MNIYSFVYFISCIWLQTRSHDIIGKELAIAVDRKHQLIHYRPNYWCPQNLNECKCEGEYNFALLTCDRINNYTLEKFPSVYYPKSDFGKFSLTNSNVNKLRRGIFGSLTFQYIYIKKTTLKTIESGVFDRMTQTLERCEITHCDVNEFPFNDLKRCSRLQVLRLTYNNITYIPDAAFGTVPLLKKIYLDFNKIKYIGSYAFKDLPNLHELDLRHNKLVVLNNNAFAVKSKNINLNLDLSYNSIMMIRNSTFHNQCPKNLYLNNNNLRSLSKDIFRPILNMMVQVNGGAIHVQENRFTCDCSKAVWLVRLRNVEKRHIKGFQCKNNNKGLDNLTLSDMGCRSFK